MCHSVGSRGVGFDFVLGCCCWLPAQRCSALLWRGDAPVGLRSCAYPLRVRSPVRACVFVGRAVERTGAADREKGK